MFFWKTNRLWQNRKPGIGSRGCMLQWFADSDHRIIYNNYDETQNEYFSEILDLQSNKKKTHSASQFIPFARDGSFALTLNFDRNSIMRPCYGYSQEAQY